MVDQSIISASPPGLNGTKPNPSASPFLDIDGILPMPNPIWLLFEILEEIAVTMLYGKSGTYKSFIALAWAICIALGTKWLGRDVKQGIAVYVAAEGPYGYKRRVIAYCHYFGIPSAQLKEKFFLLPRAVPLLDDKAVDALIAAIKQLGPHIAMVVLDTLSQCIAGNEESTTAVGAGAIKTAIRIKAELNCQVLIVHHEGKDGANGPRGSSALFNDADTVVRSEISQQRRPDDITLKVEKQKDDKKITLSLSKKDVSYGAGDRDNSCVILPRSAAIDPVQLTRTRRRMLDALVGQMKRKAWLDAAQPLHPQTFNDNVKALLNMHLVEPCDPTDVRKGYQKAGFVVSKT
jgi:hypothetical protein